LIKHYGIPDVLVFEVVGRGESKVNRESSTDEVCDDSCHESSDEVSGNRMQAVLIGEDVS